MQADEPVVAATFFDVREAEFALSVLEGSGIEGFIDQPFTGNIAQYLTVGSHNIQLFVRSSDLTRALEILSAVDESEPDAEP
jgi:hypothetical protein